MFYSFFLKNILHLRLRWDQSRPGFIFSSNEHFFQLLKPIKVTGTRSWLWGGGNNWHLNDLITSSVDEGSMGGDDIVKKEDIFCASFGRNFRFFLRTIPEHFLRWHFDTVSTKWSSIIPRESQKTTNMTLSEVRDNLNLLGRGVPVSVALIGLLSQIRHNEPKFHPQWQYG